MVLVFAIIFLLSMFTGAEVDVEKVSKQILEAKPFVLTGSSTLVVNCQKDPSPTLEAVLIRFLKDFAEPVIITSRSEEYFNLYEPTMNSLIFSEMLDSATRSFFLNSIRRIIVTEKSNFQAMLKDSCTKNDIFITYDDIACPLFHFNRYTKTLDKWNELKSDPLLASTNDVAGLMLSYSIADIFDSLFLEFVSLCLNGTVNQSLFADFMLFHLNSNDFLSVYYNLIPVYLHRNEKTFVIVPWLNRAIPSIYVITDPFDLPSWVSIMVSTVLMSLLRTYISEKHSIQNIALNIKVVLASFTTGTNLTFNRELERQLFGLFLMLSVVLINAYQSMIISYLLCPRFYPELDTLQLLNDTCCWSPLLNVSSFFLHRSKQCAYNFIGNLMDSNSPVLIQQAHDQSFCDVVDGWRVNLINKNPPLSVTSGMFRWSKQSINERPAMAWIQGDPVLAERVQSLSSAYFAEAALFKGFEADADEGKTLDQERAIKATAVSDLSLVWMMYAVGVACALLVFFREMFSNIGSVASRSYFTCKISKKCIAKRFSKLKY